MAAKKTTSKKQAKKIKVQVLKPVDKSAKLLDQSNIKLALVGAGLLLLVLVPFVGFVLLLLALIQNFRKH